MIVIGIIVVCIVGASLHFVYEISHHNKMVAIFAAVNESTWEHIKIGMTATILWSIYDGIMYINNPNYIIAKAISLLTIIVVIPILFYTYTAFTKKSILIVDIICFCITITLSQLVLYYFINTNALPSIYTYINIGLLILESICYFSLTYFPLENFIFEDPITHKYSLEGHPCSHNHKHN